MRQQAFQLGEEIVVFVPLPTAFHPGIVTGFLIDGTPLVTSNSLRRGGVVEETIQDFALGGMVWSNGFRGHLPRAAVVANARAMIGRKWTPGFNCEHFVRVAAGEEPFSPQLMFWILVGLLAGAKALKR